MESWVSFLADHGITGVAAVVIATVLFLLALWLVKKLFNKSATRLDQWRDSGLADFKKVFGVFSASSLYQFVSTSLSVVRIIITITLLEIWVLILLGSFEATRGLVVQYGNLIWDPLVAVGQAFLDYLPNFFRLAVLGIVAHLILKVIHGLSNAIQRGDVAIRGFYPDWAEPTYKIVRFFLLVMVLIFALPLLPGSNSEMFKGVSLFIGILVSLGSTSALGNVISGLALVYTRAFQIGDWVQVDNSMGEVVRTSLVATRIRTRKNVLITVPNGKVLGAHVSNYSAMARKGEGLILHANVSVGYDVPWRRVHDLLLKAAAETKGLLTDPPPFVREQNLESFAIEYQVNAYTDRPDQMARLRAELLENVLDTFEQAGVEILTPSHTRVS